VVNLFFALIWLVLGVGILVWDWLHPDAPPSSFRGSAGWLALVLCLFNLVRWYTTRAGRLTREAYQRSLRPVRRSAPDRAPDPDFDFTDSPPTNGQGPEPPR
jgi:hypothetical protein